MSRFKTGQPIKHVCSPHGVIRSRTPLPLLNLSLAAVLVSLGVACSPRKVGSPLKSQLLKDIDTSSQIETLPFQHSRTWRTSSREKYDTVLIAPITIEPAVIDSWENSSGVFIRSENDFKETLTDVNRFFHEQLIKNLQDAKERSFKLTQNAGPRVARIQIAITEALLTKPLLHAGAAIAPIPGTGLVAGALNRPGLACAIKITDSVSGALIFSAADRRNPPMRLVNANSFTVSSSAREIVSIWAELITETLVKGHLGAVEDAPHFTLLPW
jgi:hypothetical protein